MIRFQTFGEICRKFSTLLTVKSWKITLSCKLVSPTLKETSESRLFIKNIAVTLAFRPLNSNRFHFAVFPWEKTHCLTALTKLLEKISKSGNLRWFQQLILSPILKTKTLRNNGEYWSQALDHGQLKAVNSFGSNSKLLTALSALTRSGKLSQLLPALTAVVSFHSCYELSMALTAVASFDSCYKLLPALIAVTSCPQLQHLLQAVSSFDNYDLK